MIEKHIKVYFYMKATERAKQDILDNTDDDDLDEKLKEHRSKQEILMQNMSLANEEKRAKLKEKIEKLRARKKVIKNNIYTSHNYIMREKGRDLTQSRDKNPLHPQNNPKLNVTT